VISGGIASVLGAVAPWPARASGWPRRIVDALGREVEIPRRPERIVPVFSSNTEIVAALGAADRIVGIDGLTHWPPEIADRPAIGNRLGFSADRIARLGADLVILTPARHAASLLLRPLATIGVPAVVMTHATVSEVLGNIVRIGAIIDAEPAAGALVRDLRRRLDGVATRRSGRSPMRTYFETGANARGQSFSVRPGGYTDDMLRLAGGVSVFPELSGLTQVGGEAVARAEPEIVVVAGGPREAAMIRARPGWDTIPAVARGRVITVPRGLFLIPGPRIAEGVELLARALHPSAFPEAA